MGKMTPKFINEKDKDPIALNEDIDEAYRPFLIHATTCVILTEQILSLMPSDRNILLTMNEYNLKEINPMHQNDDESPTHVIIFCIRFIAGDVFQPIGGLLIYKQEDQSAILAECLKAYINDLWKLGLHVIATVSPAFETFKGMLHHLVKVNINTYTDAITYSVAPFKEIVHVYDFQFLLIKLQNLFKEGDIKFKEGTKQYRARWTDISLLLNICSEFKIISNYLTDNKDLSRRVHIFTHQIFEQVLELEAQGVLSEDSSGVAVLINCLRTFLKFTELDMVDLKLLCETDCWHDLAHILQTMTFQKSSKRTCTKVKPAKGRVNVSTSIKRKLEYNVNDYENYITENFDQTVSIDKPETANEHFSDKGAETHICNDAERLGNNKEKKHDKKKDDTMESSTKSGTIFGSSKYARTFTESKNQQRLCKNKLSCSNSLRKESEVETVDANLEINHIENKPYCKTDNSTNNVNITSTKFDRVCDNNNNGNKNAQNRSENSTLTYNNCDSKSKSKKQRKVKKKVKEEKIFDVVINDAQKFFECFSDCGTSKIPNDPPLLSDTDNTITCIESNAKPGFRDSSTQTIGEVDDDFLYADLSEYLEAVNSQSDEETEKSITKNCDQVPSIISLLDFEMSTSEEFEENSVSCEMLCTVYGMKRAIENLLKRRVKIAKPDAFIVEHIDFFVHMIKRDKNHISPVYYYGKNYQFFNTELAFVTLENRNGLYLVSK